VITLRYIEDQARRQAALQVYQIYKVIIKIKLHVLPSLAAQDNKLDTCSKFRFAMSDVQSSPPWEPGRGAFRQSTSKLGQSPLLERKSTFSPIF